VTLSPQSVPISSLTKLTEAAAAINSTLDMGDVLSRMAQLACEVTHAEVSCVFTLDPRRGRLVVLAATGQWRDVLTGQEFDAGLGIPGQVVRENRSMIVGDAKSNRWFSKQIDDLGTLRTRSIMAAPMIHHGDVVGVIEVVNRRDGAEFTETDLRVLEMFATLATSACRNARSHEDLKEQLSALRESVMQKDVVIGEAACWKRVIELCRRVGPSNATVLLLGETGTGKELTARLIHNASRRRNESFVAVNCAAMPETLLESELFGHEKGAFTGATARRRGWFEAAHGGTLFLDEIGEISRPMQAKLLRALQELTIVRVGGTQPIPCDVRVIAATNRNLKNMMIDGLFREDLYYRLSVFPIELPALRERREDIPRFVRHVVDRARHDCGIRELEVGADTMDILINYDWPGNIRELQNVVERSVLMADGNLLHPFHLPADLVLAAESTDPAADPGTLHGQERAMILKALDEHDWNQSRAAKSLGITRYHVRHRIKKYGLSRPSDHGEGNGRGAFSI